MLESSKPDAQDSATVGSALGLHLRAAGALVQRASAFEAEIFLIKGVERANAKSIMSILALAAGQGTQLDVVGFGNDAAAAVTDLKAWIQSGGTENGAAPHEAAQGAQKSDADQGR